MKGKWKYVLFASLLALGALTGCSNSSSGNDDDSGDGGNNNPINDAISGLDFTVDEAQNKLKLLGQEQGFEITLEAISEEEDGSTSKDSATIGFKGNTAWLAGEGAYVMTGAGTEVYSYTTTSGQYDYVATLGGEYFDNFINTFTSMFYIAYNFDAYLDKVGPTTFLGRPATEYKFAGQYATAFADLQIIIDDATGITLKYAGKAQDLDGNAAAGCLVVTAFKTGDAAVIPTLNKNGGGSGPVTGDVFSNKKLLVTDVSATNDDIKAKALSKYGRAYISLFADKSFEMVNPVNNTYDVAMGTFTIATDGVSAALNVTKLFDGEHQAYSTKINDELKGLVLRYDATSTDYSLKMSGLAKDGSTVEFTLILGASNDRPTHVDLPAEQGGEGGGEDPQVQYPTAGKYSYNANLTKEPGIYADGYLQINEDGTGVYCIVGNYLGERVWYTATFELDGLDIVAKTVFKYTETIETGRSKETVEQVTYTFTFEGDANWSIELNGSKIYYQYDQGQGGETPIENLDDALVTAGQFSTIVNGMAYIGAKGNAKFNKQIKSNKQVYSNESLENDNGNYQDQVTYAEGGSGSVRVYAQSEEYPGSYDIYERNSDNTWSKYGPAQYEDQIFAEMAGIYLLSQVPFAKFSAPISESAPYYACSSYEDEEYGIALSNIKVYFNKGELVRFSYTSGGYMDVDVEITDIGHVKVEVPTVTPEEKPEQHNELLYGTNGAKFVFSSVDKDGYTGTDLDAIIAAMPKVSLNFFKDGKGELINTTNDINNVFLGSYTLMIKSGSNTGTVALSLSEQYVDGLKHQSYTPETQTFTYKAQEDELHLIMTKDGHNVDFKFVRSSDVPTPFTPEGGGDQPTDSNWPAKEIAEALKSIGFESEVIPAISDSTKLTEKGTVSVVGETAVITLSFAKGGNDALLAFYGYMTMLEDEAEYKMDYFSTSAENNLYVFNSKSGEMSLYIKLDDDNGTITITAQERVKSGYPTEAISGWLLKHGVTDEIIEFTTDDASYNFDDEYNYMYITLPAEADAKTIISRFINELTTNHSYTPEDVAGSTIYVGPNRTVAFYFYAYDSMIVISFGDSSNIPQSSEGYPSDKIEEYLSDMKITDSVPAFEYEGSEYAFYGSKGEDGVWSESVAVGINLPAEAKATEVAEQFAGLLTGYIYNEDEDYYLSPNKQVCINIYVDEGFVGITIFPYEEETYEDIVYHMACDDSWAEDYGAVLFAWVWGGNYEDGQWVALVGGRGQYTLTVDETATSFIIVRCYVGTVTPDWDIEEGDVVGRIYNQTEDFWFVDYFYDEEEEWIDGYVFHFNFTSEYPDNGD